ncbi:hypothetical protein BpHYR1_001537 [Brachionus plicatilis]|uniref:Ubiquitin-like protease family profile domain-containing protein n=1 Tax=Brachionus plicatilis TaxID=10195 RepID=A0A3M7Q1U8_BRAPC|nr:hypothetical protein BpHYR1_001537 [Brachionus plicatilis]
MGKRDVQKVFNKWCKFWKFDSNPWAHRIVPHSVQRDSINCGVFVCKFLQIILDGSSDLLFDTSLLTEIRSEIKETIVTHNLD